MHLDRTYKPSRKTDQAVQRKLASSSGKTTPTLNLQRALSADAGLSAVQLLQLQKNVGNRQTRQMLDTTSVSGTNGSRSTGIMPKLSIHAPSDPYEHEADQAAARAVNQINSGSQNGDPVQRMALSEENGMHANADATVQRMESPETESEEEELQLKADPTAVQRMESSEAEEEELQLKADASVQRMESPEAEVEEEELQMKHDTTAIMRVDLPEEEQMQMKVVQKDEGQQMVSDGSQIEQNINNSLGKGSHLPKEIQAKFENAMGADFSNVTIHTDHKSDQLSKDLGARAFTTGEDIYFRQGEFNPNTSGGQHLLGHELAHVVQQKKM